MTRLSAEEVARLAWLTGVRLPVDDLEPLARALEAHRCLIEPLLSADLADVPPAVTLDPRWGA